MAMFTGRQVVFGACPLQISLVRLAHLALLAFLAHPAHLVHPDLFGMKVLMLLVEDLELSVISI
jgi:hypothetical protein